MKNMKVAEEFAAGREANGSNLRSMWRTLSRDAAHLNRTLVLFSYDEPIAVWLDSGIVVCDHDYSVATNRHLTFLRRAMIGTKTPPTLCRDRIRARAGLDAEPAKVRRAGHSTYSTRSGGKIWIGTGGPSPA